jgi:hypothetical protein
VLLTGEHFSVLNLRDSGRTDELILIPHTLENNPAGSLRHLGEYVGRDMSVVLCNLLDERSGRCPAYDA